MSDRPRISPTPRFDSNDPRNLSSIACAIADLTVQVARIANALEYQLNIEPTKFPDTSNEVIYPA